MRRRVTTRRGARVCQQVPWTKLEKAVADIPDLHEQFARGEFDGLKAWLQENIHRHGQRYRKGRSERVNHSKVVHTIELLAMHHEAVHHCSGRGR